MPETTSHRAAAAALLVGAGLALAPDALAATAEVGIVEAYAPQRIDEKAVLLTAGQDYILYGAGSDGTVYVRKPGGKAVVGITPTPDGHEVAEFRASSTAQYTLGAEAYYLPDGGTGHVYGNLFTDCRGDTQTRCTLTFIRGEEGIVGLRDYDWYRVQLKKGQRYHLSLDARVGDGFLTLRSPQGKKIQRRAVPQGSSGAIDYRAPASGVYFVAASLDPSHGRDAALSYTLDAKRK